ncbi:MAG: LytTR family DNA-binding domain-containing protein [Saprospiraceae bacterium]
MNPIKCLIVDDEPPAILLLEKYANMIDQLTIVGTCQSAVKAFDVLRNTEVDLLFIDIQMPVLNGIDFIKTLKSPPSIILTTAYREYALDGYDLDIIDYLLKPIAFDRFLKAVNRYGDRITTPIATEIEVVRSLEPLHIFFNVNKTQHKVALDEILYIESLKDYVRIHTLNMRLVVKGNLGTTMKLLPERKFLRIHRSFAIALQHFSAFNQSEVEINDQKLPIGTSYRNKVAKIMSGYGLN